MISQDLDLFVTYSLNSGEVDLGRKTGLRMEKDDKADKQSLKRLVMFFARPDTYAESRLPRIFLSLSVMVNSRPPNHPSGLMSSCSFFKGEWLLLTASRLA